MQRKLHTFGSTMNEGTTRDNIKTITHVLRVDSGRSRNQFEVRTAREADGYESRELLIWRVLGTSSDHFHSLAAEGLQFSRFNSPVFHFPCFKWFTGMEFPRPSGDCTFPLLSTSNGNGSEHYSFRVSVRNRGLCAKAATQLAHGRSVVKRMNGNGFRVKPDAVALLGMGGYLHI
eukprot:GHVU01001461.1.p2 GENE.GHVU01001461.1~~GHVU01001461.1.p2  ORF type:complete len:175 (+),score=7.37 GHVU01001461.1:749-1273(+)